VTYAERIALVSMPGGGKSTVGRHLARRLGWAFIDSDSLIESRLGCSIRSYFEREGEIAFRDIEEQVIADASNAPRTVIATGGGVVLREANRRVLRDRSVVVYLRSSADDLYRRLRHDVKRPLLQVADPLQRLREMHAQRDPLYAQTAHFSVDTGRPSVPHLVNMILMQLELAGVIDPDAMRTHPANDSAAGKY
jgi:shikimate kinase